MHSSIVQRVNLKSYFFLMFFSKALAGHRLADEHGCILCLYAMIISTWLEKSSVKVEGRGLNNIYCRDI